MEAHDQARDTYRRFMSDIGPHLSKASHIIVAVGRHDFSGDAKGEIKDRYLWIKARRRTTVEQVRQAYEGNGEEPISDITLLLDGDKPVSAPSVGELDIHHDQVVYLQAVSKLATASRSPSDVTATATRSVSSGLDARPPLQPVNRQLNAQLQQSREDTPAKAQVQAQRPGEEKFAPAAVTASHSYADPTRPHLNVPGTGTLRHLAPKHEPSPAAASATPSDHKDGGAEPVPAMSREQSQEYEPVPYENPFEDNKDDEPAEAVAPRGQPLRKLAEASEPERLEACVKTGLDMLSHLEKPLQQLGEHADAAAFLGQIESVRKEAVKSRTVVGVVGNTGAGKSSVINAMLDEERLVPTNCMRACTAVVTELSYNHSTFETSRYRAEIEFISPEDWRKELTILFEECFDDGGRPVHDARDPDSQAGIAFAKIRAVYNKMTTDMLGQASIAKLMGEKTVQSILGTTKKVNARLPEDFYTRLQHYVDSREKVEEKRDKNGKRIGVKKRPFEFWPLIKVVRIFVKADALKTGAVVVDLPGVHDSNAARAAVAESYMKQCSSLWIVSPIARAVDDKAAKKLMGDSFKRQLKFDGSYSAVTFICSKTDDISRTEAIESLKLGSEMDKIEDRLQDLTRQRKGLTAQLKEAKANKEANDSVFDDLDDKIDTWETLKDRLEDGDTVYAPAETSKKRKARTSATSRKRRRGSADSDDDIEVISSDEEDADAQAASAPTGPALTAEQIEQKLEELKNLKKESRKEKERAGEQVRDLRKQVNAIEEQEASLDDEADALCIAGRNEYSRAAIRQDFAAGVRELDQENAEEENPDLFNPDEDLRDYEEVGRSLQVFCVSSRAYQKLCDRLQKDNDVPGFATKEQTGIPDLQAHCRKLTEAGRAANCRRFLNSLSRLVSSLALWASDDGSGPKMNAQQHNTELQYLRKRLADLEKALEKAVNTAIGEVQDTMKQYVFDMFGPACDAAVKAANKTQASWGAHRNDGGLFWATYKATTRRSGVFQGASGLRDFNNELTDPMMKSLQNHWEKTFQRKLPHILRAFSRVGSKLLKVFHAVIETRCRAKGHGIARSGMLGAALRDYEHVFTDASTATVTHVNERQRDINREFVPVVTGIMQDAYDQCNDECGPGSYKRMKLHMERFVDEQKTSMFQDACNEVKSHLDGMCEEVRKSMLERVGGVFTTMQRDYMSLVGGVDVGQTQLPFEERSARRQVDELVTRVDVEFEKVAEMDLEALQLEGEAAKEGGEVVEEMEVGKVEDDFAEEVGEEDEEEDEEEAEEDEQEDGEAADAGSKAAVDDEDA